MTEEKLTEKDIAYWSALVIVNIFIGLAVGFEEPFLIVGSVIWGIFAGLILISGWINERKK